MNKKYRSRGYELHEYTAEEAAKDNLNWFASLSPAQKIWAIEQEVKVTRYLRSLKRVPPKK